MPVDKILHLLAGFSIAALLAPFVLWWALVPVALAAAGKEWRDRQGHGTYEARDFWWTVGGGVAAVLVHLALVHMAPLMAWGVV